MPAVGIRGIAGSDRGVASSRRTALTFVRCEGQRSGAGAPSWAGLVTLRPMGHGTGWGQRSPPGVGGRVFWFFFFLFGSAETAETGVTVWPWWPTTRYEGPTEEEGMAWLVVEGRETSRSSRIRGVRQHGAPPGAIQPRSGRQAWRAPRPPAAEWSDTGKCGRPRAADGTWCSPTTPRGWVPGDPCGEGRQRFAGVGGRGFFHRGTGETGGRRGPPSGCGPSPGGGPKTRSRGSDEDWYGSRGTWLVLAVSPPGGPQTCGCLIPSTM